LLAELADIGEGEFGPHDVNLSTPLLGNKVRKFFFFFQKNKRKHDNVQSCLVLNHVFKVMMRSNDIIQHKKRIKQIFFFKGRKWIKN
jgi:hypothetical protein